jgi:hypothetical protein
MKSMPYVRDSDGVNLFQRIFLTTVFVTIRKLRPLEAMLKGTCFVTNGLARARINGADVSCWSVLRRSVG